MQARSSRMAPLRNAPTLLIFSQGVRGCRISSIFAAGSDSRMYSGRSRTVVISAMMRSFFHRVRKEQMVDLVLQFHELGLVLGLVSVHVAVELRLDLPWMRRQQKDAGSHDNRFHDRMGHE